MKFDDYLTSKNIDSKKYKAAEPVQYAEFREIFDQVHPNSFTQQKLFLINKIRRNYQLENQAEIKKSVTSKVMRPKIKPLKPKTS